MNFVVAYHSCYIVASVVVVTSFLHYGQEPKWLDRSVAIYNWTWKSGWDGDCGGFWWNTCGNQLFKDSITIMEILHFGSKLAYMFPNETWYLDSAQKIWDWIFSFNDGYGLMSDKYLVSTGAVPEQCCNSTVSDPLKKCLNTNVSGTSYNQGLLLSASAYLYKRTKNHTYLDVGMRALEAVLTNYTTIEGILIDEPRSYQTFRDKCFAWEDPGGDWYSFQGIFMNHLSYFTTLLADGVTLSNENLTRIMKLVEQTSDAAWSKSAVQPPFKDGVDACNIGPSNPNVTYPKFHWWWGEETVQQIIPPDPHIFFHRVQLRCVTANGNNTQLWEGMVATEDRCKAKCARNPKCSKYLFQIDQSKVQGYNCWIWSYNRSDHNCQQQDAKFNIGIKRPFGAATCASRCGSKDPIKLAHGVCYCDPDCLTHLDCCLDYADQCTPNKSIPSCKGLCKKTQALAIPGGGYCWCSEGCNPWYTDNNSDGSCCPDYNQECLHKTMPTCLDARSQGSALNLFLAHLKLMQEVAP